LLMLFGVRSAVSPGYGRDWDEAERLTLNAHLALRAA
jgi:hypothetical protein